MMNQLSKEILENVRKSAQEEGISLQEAIGIFQLHESVRSNQINEGIRLLLKSVVSDAPGYNYHIRVKNLIG